MCSETFYSKLTFRVKPEVVTVEIQSQLVNPSLLVALGKIVHQTIVMQCTSVDCPWLSFCGPGRLLS